MNRRSILKLFGLSSLAMMTDITASENKVGTINTSQLPKDASFYVADEQGNIKFTGTVEEYNDSAIFDYTVLVRARKYGFKPVEYIVANRIVIPELIKDFEYNSTSKYETIINANGATMDEVYEFVKKETIKDLV